MKYPAADFTEASSIRRFVAGTRYAVYGVRVVVTHPTLWLYVLMPVFITLTLFSAGFLTVGVLIPWLTTWIWTPGPHDPRWVWISYYVILWSFRITVGFALAVVLYLTAGLVATPFNDLLSEQVERQVLGRGPDETPWGQFLRDLWWSLVHSVVSLVLYLMLMIVAFLLNFLPGIGSVASFLVGTVGSGLFFAREAMDGCFSRRRFAYRDKWRIVMHHWPTSLGFGVIVGLLMWVPFLNFLVLPMSVAGGTLLYCHLERGGHLPEA